MDDPLSLFGSESPPAESTLGRPSSDAPLAARFRPRSLEEFYGQRTLVDEGRALHALIAGDRVPSLIFWGPPGCGKTTLALIIAGRTKATFEPFSAATHGVPRLRKLIAAAEERRRMGRETILFVDEIHRFNKAQQDALLPHVEAGTVTLIGATTENPSFEVVGPLLSRTRVFVLEPLSAAELEEICRAALADGDRGLGDRNLRIDDEALAALAAGADGDARRALNALETAADLVEPGGTIGLPVVEEALQRRFAHYDKAGEQHFNLISALHKAVRGSDPDGALYWLSRMLEGGEDALYIARRLVRMAVEDVGLADPRALSVCVAARDAYHFLGSPEGDLALGEAAVYLAAAPKSNRLYRGFGAAREAAARTPAEPVPLHLRNAPTRLMRELGYGREYRYDPDEPEGVAAQHYLPERLRGTRFYEPGDSGEEAEVADRLRRLGEARARSRKAESPPREPDPSRPRESGPSRPREPHE